MTFSFVKIKFILKFTVSWGYSRKKPNIEGGGARVVLGYGISKGIKEIACGIIKKGLIKNEVEFPRVTKKK